ncbi:hypothetical protein MJO28_013529 [Puccinia striiformis f. sp. tritici]|uniref:Uncharacterized protein n=1 Tax=Puccinia striiformis f. sp. tritici TaxID=168172 RepID=A0ACC0DWF7_9BASI|nr:hypothetical protein MJO28_013529 [Puccinia striiformis f. sp. tritici]
MQSRLLLLLLPLARDFGTVSCHRHPLIRRGLGSHMVHLDDHWPSAAELPSQGDLNFKELSNTLETGSPKRGAALTPELLPLFPLGEFNLEGPANTLETGSPKPSSEITPGLLPLFPLGHSNYMELPSTSETASPKPGGEITPEIQLLFPLGPDPSRVVQSLAATSHEEENRPAKRPRLSKNPEHWYSQPADSLRDSRQDQTKPSSSIALPPILTSTVQTHALDQVAFTRGTGGLRPEKRPHGAISHSENYSYHSRGHQAGASSSNVPPMPAPRIQMYESGQNAQQHEHPWAGLQHTLPAPIGINLIPTTQTKLANILQLHPTRSSLADPVASSFTHSKSSPMRPFHNTDRSGPSTLPPPKSSRGPFWSHLPGNEFIREHYSCQILDWDPPKDIDQKAALAAHAMVIELKNAVAAKAAGVYLNALHDSHMIYIPFVYKIMTKKLKAHHWSRILEAWRSIWERDLKQPHTRHNTLRKFIWISDLITEASIPKLFERERLTFTKNRAVNYRFRFVNHEAKLVKLLSDGRVPLKRSNYQLTATAEYLNLRFQPPRNQLDSHYLEDIVAMEETKNSLITRLKSQAEVINRGILDIIAVFPSDPRDWTNSPFRNYLKEVLVRKNRHPQSLPLSGTNIPFTIQQKIAEIVYSADPLQEQSLATPIKYHTRSDDYFAILGDFDLDLRSEKRGPTLLPKIIHDYFEKKFNKLEKVQQRILSQTIPQQFPKQR